MATGRGTGTGTGTRPAAGDNITTTSGGAGGAANSATTVTRAALVAHTHSHALKAGDNRPIDGHWLPSTITQLREGRAPSDGSYWRKPGFGRLNHDTGRANHIRGPRLPSDGKKSCTLTIQRAIHPGAVRAAVTGTSTSDFPGAGAARRRWRMAVKATTSKRQRPKTAPVGRSSAATVLLLRARRTAT